MEFCLQKFSIILPCSKLQVFCETKVSRTPLHCAKKALLFPLALPEDHYQYLSHEINLDVCGEVNLCYR